MRECIIIDCTNTLTTKSAKKMCSKHYKRLLSGKNPSEPTEYDSRPPIKIESYYKIPLGVGAKDGYAFVDDDCVGCLDYKWHLTNKKRTKTHRYVSTNQLVDGKYKELKLHQLVMGTPPVGKVIDHINGDKLDNRKSNLRFVTKQQNSMNHSVYDNNTSGYIGAYLHKPSGGWMSKIGHNGKLVHIGTFRTAEEAARARDGVARELHGEFAVLNFPDDQCLL